MNIWRRNIKRAVSDIADKEFQRRAWLGIGPEESSPDEDFCQLLDDASVEDYLRRDDTGLNQIQKGLGNQLIELMRSQLPHRIRGNIKPENLIDDPRMIKVREAAKQFLAVL